MHRNEVKCSTFDMEIIFHSNASKTHFHKKGCALGLIFKVRVLVTRKWPIACNTDVRSSAKDVDLHADWVSSSDVNKLTRQEFSSTSHRLRQSGVAPH